MAKKPSFQFYPGDWLKDPCLGMCSLATRGHWMEMLCLMHENDHSGELRGTISQLARTCRSTEKEMAAALNELAETGTADVIVGDMSPKCPHLSPKSPGVVTVINRRMQRDKKRRDYERLKKSRQREQRNVPEKSRSLSSSSTSVKKRSPPLSPPSGTTPGQRSGDNSRGTRFARNGAIPSDWHEWARAAGHPDPPGEFERFADYWTAQPGTKGRKSDWLATWRNWVRRSIDDGRARKGGRYETPYERIHRLNADPADADVAGPAIEGHAEALDPDG